MTDVERNTVLRIRVDFNNVSGTYMAVKDYGDDFGYLEEIGEGITPAGAVKDLLTQCGEYGDYTHEAYTEVRI